MHPYGEVETLGELEFKWGKKRGLGGKKKDIQFYDSFTYDGEEYMLYDCVYMYKEGQTYPYIGKIIKMWEHSDRSKKIKVQWFFRPMEISYYLEDLKVLENELFLASGVGRGLANVNPLETVAGKCNIVCTSTDARNPWPSIEELQGADYVFYRTFDVGTCTISDQLGDLVGGLSASFVFNRKMGAKSSNVAKENSNGYYGEKDVKGLRDVAIAKSYQGVELRRKEDEHVKQDQVGKANFVAESMMGSEKSTSVSKYSTEVDAFSSKEKKIVSTSIDEELTATVDRGKNSRFNVIKAIETSKSESVSGYVDDPPSKRAKFDIASSTKDRDIMISQNLTAIGKELLYSVDTSIFTNARPKQELTNSIRPRKNVKVGEKFSPTTSTFSSETSSSLDCKDSKGLQGIGKQFGSSGDSSKRPISEAVGVSKNKSNGTSDAMEGGLTKKMKFDHAFKISNDAKANVPKKSEGKIKVDVEKPSTKPLTSRGDKDLSALNKGALKGHVIEKNMLTNKKLPKSFDVASEDSDFKTGGQIFYVTRRPIERGNWIKMPWEEKVKVAHDQGKLVLLQNLSPEYISAEVEDIIWHAFGEECTAKMVQCTATSSPHSAQALVVLKTREAVVRVMEKLDQGCLMLPNKRPLVARTGFPLKSLQKPNVFFGHLKLDKVRRQEQRQHKDAISTSHCSQNNTIEYEMAMSWCLLQSKADKWWEMLYERHGNELKKLTGDLKSKSTV